MKLVFQPEFAFRGRGAWAFLAPFLAWFVSLSHAQIVWTGAGADANWSTSSNWSTGIAPMPGAQIVFGASGSTSNTVDLSLLLNSISYGSGAPSFTTTITQGNGIEFVGAGISNASGAVQSIVVAGSSDPGISGGNLQFSAGASAGNAHLTTQGGIRAGTISFAQGTTAADATLVISGGSLTLRDEASGGHATVSTSPQGVVDISGLSTTGTTFGSIAGSGLYDLGAKNLTTGSLNTSTELSGTLSGTGGSLTKVGTGTLTLSGAAEYTGRTTVEAGRLTITGTFDQRSAVTVAAGATLDLAGTTAMRLGATNSLGGTVHFTGSGNLELGSGTTTNSGTFNATNNTTSPIAIVGPGTFTNTGSFNASGTGQVHMNGVTAFTNAGSGAVNISGLLALDGGTAFRNTTTATTTISGANGGLALLSGAIDNEGVMSITGSSIMALYLASGQTMRNAAGATLNLSGSGNIAGSGSLVNAGTINKTTAANVIWDGLGALDNTGTINVSAGTVRTSGTHLNNKAAGNVNIASGATFNSGNYFTNQGHTTVASGGTIVFEGFDGLVNEGTLTVNGTGTATFNGGTYQFKDGSVITGTGTATFTPNAYTITGTSTIDLAQTTWAGGMLAGGGTLEVQKSTAVTGSLILQGGTTLHNSSTGTLTISGTGGILAVVNGSALNEGAINVSGSSAQAIYLDTTGTLTNAVGATLSFTGQGSMGGAGTLENRGTINKSTTANVEWNGLGALNNTGTINVSAGTLRAGGVHFNNKSDGNVNIASGATFESSAFFTNQGRTTVASGGAILFGGTNALVNEGTLAVNGTGTATFNGGTYRFTDGSRITGTGSATFTPNAYTITGTSTIDLAQTTWASGMLAGGGTLEVQKSTAVTGSLILQEGTTLRNSSTGTLTISGTGGILAVVNGSALNEGAINVSGSSAQAIYLDTTGTLTNAVGATLSFTGQGNLVGAGTLENRGTINKSTAANVVWNSVGAVNNTGTINVSTGTLHSNGSHVNNLTGGRLNVASGATFESSAFFTNQGTVAVASGGAIVFGGTDALVNAGTLSVSGTGTATFNDGAYRFNDASVINGTGSATFNAAAYTLTGTSTVSTATTTWAGGTFAGTGTLVQASASTLTGSLTIDEGATFQNAGTMSVTSGTIGGVGAGTNTGTFSNSGTINKSGSGTLLLSGLDAFNNSGTFNVTAGTLNLTSYLSNTGQLTVASGATLLAPSGGGLDNHATLTVHGTLDTTGGGLIAMRDGATITGTGTAIMADDVFVLGTATLGINSTWTDGVVGGGTLVQTKTATVTGDFGVFADGTLRNTGTMMFAEGSSLMIGATGNNGTFENRGTVSLETAQATTGQRFTNAAGGTVNWTGSGSFEVDVVENAGTFNAVNNRSTPIVLRDAWGIGSDTFNNTGTFTKSGTGELQLVDLAAFNNVGTLNVTAGSLTSNQAFTNTGRTVISSGAQMTLTGENALVNHGTITVNGTGVLNLAADREAGDYITFGNGSRIDGTGTVQVASLIELTGTSTLAARSTWTEGIVFGPGTLVQTGQATITGIAGMIEDVALQNTGTIAISGSGSLLLADGATYTQTAGNLNIAAGATLDVSATSAAVFNGGALRGNGTIAGDSTFNSGSLLAPGNSIGTLNFEGDVTWNSGSSLQMEIANVLGGPGVANDFVNITSGSLQLPASGFTLTLAAIGTGGLIDGFNTANDYNWTIATATGGILGYTADSFTLVTSSLRYYAWGTWSVFQSGNDLVLGYVGALAPVPEPSTYAALALAVCAAFAAWRRHQKNQKTRKT